MYVKQTFLSLIIYLSNANVNMTISKNIDSIKLQPSVLFAFVELFKYLIVTNFHRHSQQKEYLNNQDTQYLKIGSFISEDQVNNCYAT